VTGTASPTPSLSDDALRQLVRALADRAEISDLIDRFARDLDDYTRDGRPFDVAWVRSYFTDDAEVDYPIGTARGAEAIATLIDGQGMAPFQRTQHITTNHIIDLDGHRAGLRFNLIATHVHAEEVRRQRGEEPGAHFTVGDYYEGEAIRTDAGWRFERQSLRVTWTEGSAPG
jgi:SnoaL-like domain